MALRSVVEQRKRGANVHFYQVARLEGDEAEDQLERWSEELTSAWEATKWNLKKTEASDKHRISSYECISNYECSYSCQRNFSCPALLRISRLSDSLKI
uniref:Uncharacterized protein n=1 Tax=Ditylenchus dipsaci TaxID=166011 RepID=A0A915DU12_9BILA